MAETTRGGRGSRTIAAARQQFIDPVTNALTMKMHQREGCFLMRYLAPRILALGILFCFPAEASAESIVTHASGSLEIIPASPFGGLELPSVLQVYEAAKDGISIDKARSWLTQAYDAKDGTVKLATVNASASLSVQRGQIRVGVDATMSGDLTTYGPTFPAFAQVNYSLEWTDTFRFEWMRDTTEPFLPPLANVSILSHGNMSGSITPGAFSPQFNRSTVVQGGIFGPVVATEVFGERALGVPSFEFEARPDGSGRYNATFFIRGTLWLGASGRTSFDGRNTFQYGSILLPDGTTPESQGWRVVFESGIDSPNVVPEPSSFLLLGFGTIALWWSGRGRRKSG